MKKCERRRRLINCRWCFCLFLPLILPITHGRAAAGRAVVPRALLLHLPLRQLGVVGGKLRKLALQVARTLLLLLQPLLLPPEPVLQLRRDGQNGEPGGRGERGGGGGGDGGGGGGGETNKKKERKKERKKRKEERKERKKEYRPMRFVRNTDSMSRKRLAARTSVIMLSLSMTSSSARCSSFSSMRWISCSCARSNRSCSSDGDDMPPRAPLPAGSLQLCKPAAARPGLLARRAREGAFARGCVWAHGASQTLPPPTPRGCVGARPHGCARVHSGGRKREDFGFCPPPLSSSSLLLFSSSLPLFSLSLSLSLCADG